MIKTGAVVAGGLAASFGASLCCIGPALAAFVGLGSAGLAAAVEPLRPYLLAAGGTLFLVAGLTLYRRPVAGSAEGEACGVAAASRRSKVLFWIAVGIAAILAAFPWWSGLLP